MNTGWCTDEITGIHTEIYIYGHMDMQKVIETVIKPF